MLLLHVVAVGGFFASSVLKEKDSKRDQSETSAPLDAEDSQLPSKGGLNSAGKKVSASPGANRPRTHVVRPGETLTLIANENGVTLEALVAANGADTVTTGLRAGQELKLPEKSPDPNFLATDAASAFKLVEGHPNKPVPPSATNPSPTVTSSTHPVADSGKSYVVLKGDSAYTIAQKNKVNYDALLKINQIDDPKKIKLGQKLRLPQSTNKPKPNQT